MLKLVNTIEEANFATHSGSMHADEVFATAFLELYFEDIKLLRTTNINPSEHENILVYDIGRGRFDHHMVDAKTRDNGIKYCSFGLLWQEFGRDFLTKRNIDNVEEVFNYFDKDFVEQIDAIDNGVFPNIQSNYKVKTMFDVIKLFNPSIGSDQDENTQFIKVEAIAREILEQEILNCIGKVQTKHKIDKYLENNNNRYLILDEYLPYEEFVLNSSLGEKILFVIYPSTRGGYCIKTVPVSVKDRSNRMSFPKEWGGLDDEELEKVSGIKDITFCHANLFLVSTKTKEAALEVVNKLIDMEEL